MSKRQRRQRSKSIRHGRPAARSIGAGGGIALAATLVSGSVAEAATYTVTSTADTSTANAANCTPDVTNDPNCRLRDAITAANANAPSTIVFASSLSGSINLAAALPAITSAMTIQGPGTHAANPITVDGGGNYRDFEVNGHVDVGISGLTIAHGMTTGRGGGIYAHGGSLGSRSHLIVSDVKISGNTAASGGGIESHKYSDTTVRNSTISGNHSTNTSSSGYPLSGGGGIDAHQGATIDNTTISGNTSGTSGGGALLTKYASIKDSTISGNTAAQAGGGIDNFGFTQPGLRVEGSTISGNAVTAGPGGGVSAKYGVVERSTLSGNTASGAGGGLDGKYSKVHDSTVTGNSSGAPGGGIYLARFGEIDNSTVAGNTATGAPGGGVYANGGSSTTPTTVYSSVIANNTGTPDADVSGTFNSYFSLIRDQSGATFSKTAHNVAAGTDPQLGPLASNGGPTQTLKPSTSSPVIDQGADRTTLAIDQRGLPVFDLATIPNPPGGDGRDIGAVELQSSDFPVPPVPAPNSPTPPSPPTPPIPPPPSNQFGFLDAFNDGTHGSIAVDVSIPGPGTLDVLGTHSDTADGGAKAATIGLIPGFARFAYGRTDIKRRGPGKVRIVLHPNSGGRRMLDAARTNGWDLNISTWVTFTPTGGFPRSKELNVRVLHKHSVHHRRTARTEK